MGTYQVIQDFAGKTQLDEVEQLDSISVSPYWILLVIQFKHPITYRRKSLKSSIDPTSGARVSNTDGNGSFSNFFPDAVDIRGQLVITSDCVQLSTTSTKGNHVTSLNATLIRGEANYLNEIMPGDYVFAWIMNDSKSYDRVLSRIEKGDACNDFLDGLKFMGQAQNIRKNLSVSPMDGTKSVHFTLSAAGFTPFDTQLFYEPGLEERIQGLANLFKRYGASLTEILNKEGTGVDVNKAIPAFLDILLGKGVSQNLGRENPDPRTNSTAGLDAPYGFMIPKAVGKVFGRQPKVKTHGFISFADLLDVIMGVQSYSNEGVASGAKTFAPDGTLGSSSTRKETGTLMMGNFVPMAPQFTNQPVWSVLNQYLNPASNEMYTCLRVNADNKVVPTLIVRQLPFTSSLYEGNLPVTRFLELPRWKIPSILVKSADIGRSDSLRFNFIHVYGQPTNSATGSYLTEQIVSHPPMRDDLDIARNGLRGWFQTVACSAQEVRAGDPTKWMELLADIAMTQCLTMTGTISMVGIQAPICPGDNLEWDGVVLHIESVTHNCSITSSGIKSFSTNVQLTHGVRSNPGESDLSIYAGIRHGDISGFDPGHTREDARDPNQFTEPANVEDVLAKRQQDMEENEVEQLADGAQFSKGTA